MGLDAARDRDDGGSSAVALRVKFCLDRLEKASFCKGVTWSKEIVKNLTVEELVGALVATEQLVLDFPGELMKKHVVDFLEGTPQPNTLTWLVRSTETGQLIGRVAWFGGGYCFQAETGGIMLLNSDQLGSISWFLKYRSTLHRIEKNGFKGGKLP